MTFDEYQARALGTDRNPISEGVDKSTSAVAIPLYGLAGEVGSLLSLYKKFLRDGDAYAIFQSRLQEEIGDILWYTSNVASKFGISLGETAAKNLHKVEDRWLPATSLSRRLSFDEEYPAVERLPRVFEATFSEDNADGRSRMILTCNGVQIGDKLTDNSRSNDGYRFHDAFHLSYACKLGWSPVTRKLLECKRHSNEEVDNVEDGGRAIAYEEAISGLVFEHASDHGFYEYVSAVDFHILDSVKLLTRNLEVSERSTHDWEEAILDGFRVWRFLRSNTGGTIRFDLDERTMTVVNGPHIK